MQKTEMQTQQLPRVKDLCPFLDQVKGFLTPEEGRLLQVTGFQAAALGPCLEIGGYCGLSTIYLGLGVQEKGGVLFSLDHHHGSEEHQPGQDFFDPELFDPELGSINSFPEFKKNISNAGLKDTVAPLVCSSELAARMWATPLALVFIDGGHSEQTARADYALWAKHIMPGGYLAIHDIFFDPALGGQAPHLIYQQALLSGKFSRHEFVQTLALLRRSL